MLHPTRLSLSMSGATPQAAQLPAVLKTSLVQAGRHTTYNAVTNALDEQQAQLGQQRRQRPRA